MDILTLFSDFNKDPNIILEDQPKKKEAKKILKNILLSPQIGFLKIQALELLYFLYLKDEITKNYYQSTLEEIAESIVDKEERDSYFIEFYIKYLYIAKILDRNFSQEINFLDLNLDKRIISTYYYYLAIYKFYNLNYSYSKLAKELLEIKKILLLSKKISENRLDSEFYLSIVIFFLDFINDVQPIKMEKSYKDIEKSLYNWLYYSTEENRNLEKQLLVKIKNLKNLKENLSTERKWLDYERKLIDISYLIEKIWLINIKNEEILEKISQNLFKDLILQKFHKEFENLLPKINSLIENTNNILVKETFLKLEKELKDKQESFNYENWNKILLKLMYIIEKKNCSNIYQTRLKNIIENKKNSDQEKFYQLLCTIDEIFDLNFGFETGFPKGDNILNNLIVEIKKNLPDFEDKKLYYFSKVIAIIINYIFNISQMPKQSFPIYYEDYKGKLQEKDFQYDLFNYLRKSNFSSYISIENTNIADGGRVDILFKIDDIVFPIEIKKTTNKNLDNDFIEKNYIAQAQTYTYTYDQLGIFIVIDLSKKTKSYVPNDISDLINIHHIKPHFETLKKFPNYVISFIIPANRLLPSEKSNYK